MAFRHCEPFDRPCSLCDQNITVNHRRRKAICDNCKKEQARKKTARWKKDNPGRSNVTDKNRRDYLKTLGICTTCRTAKAETDRVQCASCSNIAKEKNRKSVTKVHVTDLGEKIKVSRFLIYALSDPIDGAIRYVGRSSDGLDRPRAHMLNTAEFRSKTYKAIWVRSIVRMGLIPTIEIIEEFSSSEELPEAERFWISQIRSWGFRLTNLSDGGEGANGVPKSPETLEKLSASLKAFYTTEEGHAVIAKNVARQLGRKRSPESIEKTRIGKTGQKLSDESKIRMSRARGGRPFVDQNGQRYETQSQAAKALHISQASINSILNGKTSRTRSGFIFRYIPDA